MEADRNIVEKRLDRIIYSLKKVKLLITVRICYYVSIVNKTIIIIPKVQTRNPRTQVNQTTTHGKSSKPHNSWSQHP